MKNYVLNAFIILSLISVVSCNNDDDTADNPEEVNQVIGDWQMYRSESLESTLDEWTGTEWTLVDRWFKSVFEDSEILITFNSDGTFTEFYATVETATGTWEKIEDGRYLYNYTVDADNTNDAFVGTRFITVYCDNTYSVTKENDDRSISYYRTKSTTECSSMITYNVE